MKSSIPSKRKYALAIAYTASFTGAILVGFAIPLGISSGDMIGSFIFMGVMLAITGCLLAASVGLGWALGVISDYRYEKKRRAR